MPDSSPPVPLSLFDGKCCTVCGQWKPLKKFKAQKQCADGRHPRCRDCAISPGDVKRWQRAFWARHRDEFSAKRKTERQNNGEAVRAKDRARHHQTKPPPVYPPPAVTRDANGVEGQVCNKCGLWLPLERFQLIKRCQGGRNPRCKSCARNRAWERAHKRFYWHRRRAAGTLNLADWLAICAAYDGTCAYCGEAKRLTVDHVIPVSKGGLTTRDNIVPACDRCNKRKNNRQWTPRPPLHPPQFD